MSTAIRWLQLCVTVRSISDQHHYHGLRTYGCPIRAQYKDGEPVRLWVNKVGPYDNPQETYNYYYLPFCAPRDAGKPKHKWGGLGEVLQGNELIDSQLEVKFKSELLSH